MTAWRSRALLSSPPHCGIELCASPDHHCKIELCRRALLSPPPLRTMELSALAHYSHLLLGWSPATCRIMRILFQNCSVFLPYLPFRLGVFSSNQLGQVFLPTSPSISPYQLLIFLLSYPTGLGGFSPIACSLIFWFSSSVPHWVRRFFIDRSRIVLIISPGLGA